MYEVKDNPTHYNEIATGNIEKIGESSSKLSFRNLKTNDTVEKEEKVENHQQAIDQIVSLLSDKEHCILSGSGDLRAVGHRLVHGGDNETFHRPTKVNDDIFKLLKEIEPLAPLHIPANVGGVEKTMEMFPDVPQYLFLPILLAVLYCLIFH